MRKTAVIVIVALVAVVAVILRSAPGIAQPATASPGAWSRNNGGSGVARTATAVPATQPATTRSAAMQWSVNPFEASGYSGPVVIKYTNYDEGTVSQPAEVTSGSEVTILAAASAPVTFDGHVSKFEYGDATHVDFRNNHGIVNVFIKVSDGYLYFAYQIPDLSPFMGDDIVTMLDLKNEKAAAPTKDTIRAYVRRKMENSRTQEGDGTKWVDNYGPWEYRSALYGNGWEVETRIPLKAINVEMNPGPGKKTTLGVAFRIWDNEPEKMSNWPAGSSEKKPETWGKLVIE